MNNVELYALAVEWYTTNIRWNEDMLIYLQTIYSQEDKDLFIYIYEHHKKQIIH